MQRSLQWLFLLLFALTANAGSTAAEPLVGMYVHQHWPYKRPYAARTWTLEQWRGYAGGLKRLGYNAVLIWPMVETMPIPPTPSDLAALDKTRRVIDMLHEELDMTVHVVVCPNVAADDELAAQSTFEERHFFYVDRRVDPADPVAVEHLMQGRRQLLGYLAAADAFTLIDSDPSGWPGSTNDEFVALLGEYRELFDRLRPGIELNYWMHAGWPAYSRFYASGEYKRGTDEEFVDAIEKLQELDPEPWGLANGVSHPRPEDVRDRVISFNYGAIESEPSFPVTRFGGDRAEKAGAAAAPRGVMGNAQTHAIQLPNTFAFARGALGMPVGEEDYVRFAEELIPGQGRLIVDAWRTLQGNEPPKMRRLASELDGVAESRPSAGVLEGLLFGSPERFLRDLAYQLRMRAAEEEFYRAVDADEGVGDALGRFASAASAWQRRHGYEDKWRNPRLRQALAAVNADEINVVLDPPIYAEGFEKVRQSYYLAETETPRLLDAMKAASSRLTAQPVEPPSEYDREVERWSRGQTESRLVVNGRPAFSIAVAGPTDVVLETAAADFARYFEERFSGAPEVHTGIPNRGDVVVLVTRDTAPQAARALGGAAPDMEGLGDQGFVIERIERPDGGYALLCVGGSSIGARYALVELIRRLEESGEDRVVRLDGVRDEPYSTWRAIYINDSSHQLNNYSPNLIYPVETYRWSDEKWERYIDQMAFFRYNVLIIWIVPNMFSPEVFNWGEEFAYFRDTMRRVAQYAKPRGIELSLLNGVNVGVKAGSRLDTIPTPVYADMPLYTYLNPKIHEEKELLLKMWDHWSKAIPEVGIWELFPGDPGGCHEVECGPETYVDLSLELAQIIRKNNPTAKIDFTPWQFFGWGYSWPLLFRKDMARVDRGYRYLMSKLDEFPPDSLFSPNLNDATSEAPVAGAGGMGGSTAKYIEQMARRFPVHTWTYFVTEGEGWINHHYRVPDILKQRDIEARYPIAGGLCYTMTPSLNILNQFACAESFWDPRVTEAQVMERYGEGIWGTSDEDFTRIFPYFHVAPTIGYTFHRGPEWKPDYAGIAERMRIAEAELRELDLRGPTRYVIQPSRQEYANELFYYTDLYQDVCALGEQVARARAIVHELPAWSARPEQEIGRADAQRALESLEGPRRDELKAILAQVTPERFERMKTAFEQKHYQIFKDYETEFTPLLPILVDGFFESFGLSFVE